MRWTAEVLGAAAERSGSLVMEMLGRAEKSGGIRGRGELRSTPRPSRHRPSISEKSNQVSESSGSSASLRDLQGSQRAKG